MIDREAALRAHGANVVGQDGDKVGTVQDIYLDHETNEPEWVLVASGMAGGRGNFVPLNDATMEGNEIRVPYKKDRVNKAPSVDPDGQLSQQEERELYDYYGRAYSDYTDVGTLERERAGRTDYETRSTGTDEAMTRSEEELHVGTEQVQTTVPVQREEVRLEREPITEANVDTATSGPDITEAEHEVVLTEEQPVVETRTVPKERVRLEKDTVTDEKQVTEEVRKEHVETEGDTPTRTDDR